jgi:hypothetical protein
VSFAALTARLLIYCKVDRTKSLGSCYSLVLALVSSLLLVLVTVEGLLSLLARIATRTTTGILEVISEFVLLLEKS